MDSSKLKIRLANVNDLNSINQIIAAAVMNWNLPERVKRLALPSYNYTEVDLEYLQIHVVNILEKDIALLATENTLISLHNNKALLIHGIYVHPDNQNGGVGQYLFEKSEQLARAKKAEALLVKAQKDAEGFFLTMGMEKINIENNHQDYNYLYWKSVI